MHYLQRLAAATVAAFTLFSCLKDKTIAPVAVAPCADTVSFSTVILSQIINTSCNTSGCHSQAAAAAGYTLVNHDQVATHAARILRTLRHDNSVTAMPIGADKLPDSLIQAFDCWIQQGKLNN